MNKNIFESISLKIRKGMMVSRVKTFLIIAILFVAFLLINFGLEKVDLPKFDITENKIHSLEDKSKKELEKVDKKISLFVYGYDEESSVVNLIKQCKKVNDNISYQIINDTDNLDIVKKYNLETGNYAVVLECENSQKILYSSDFVTYDYSSWTELDLTENVLVNSILNLTIAQKPKIYILTGHNELSPNQYLSVFLSYMSNKVFEFEVLNLLTVSEVPSDCDLLAVFSPQKDLIESEYNILQNYINNGGNLIITNDFYTTEEIVTPYWDKIMELYGLKVENGLICEYDTSSHIEESNYLIFPHIENTDVTSDLAESGALLIEAPRRIISADETRQNELNVTYENLLTSSENSYFISDFSTTPIAPKADQTPEKSIIAIKATKKINVNTGSEGENNTDTKESKIIVVANGTFISNLESVKVTGNMQVNVLDNADFFGSAISNLTNRKDTINIQKDTNASTFLPTAEQTRVIIVIIYSVPIIIILLGIIVWNYRKHKR